MIKRILIFLVVMLLLTGCEKAAQESSTRSKGATTVEAKKVETFTNANFSEVISNADDHKGANVKIKGQVFAEPKKQGDVWQFQINADPKKHEGNTIVIGQSDFDIKADMYLEIEGTVEGQEEYENAFGAKMSAPLIRANKILKDSEINTLAPTQNAVTVNQAQDQNGILITLEKIEFAEEETRFYIKAKNNTNKNANVYSFDMKVTQGNQQFEPESKFSDDYPEIKSEILPGIESAGIVVFKKIDYNAKQLNFIAEASSENYELNFNPYTFQIQW